MTTATTPPARPITPFARLRNGLTRTARLILGIAIGLLGLSLARTGRDLFHAPPPPAPRTAAPARAAAVPRLGAILPGRWSLGDSAWSFTNRPITTVTEELRGLGEHVETDREPAALERLALTWLQRRGQHHRVKDLTVYEARLGSGSVRAVSQGSAGSERLRLVQLLTPGEGGLGNVLEAVPRRRQEARKEGGHLLPLPAGVSSVARRWDRDGRLSGELVGPAPTESLTAHWRSRGWFVQEADLGTGKGRGYVCRRGPEVVLAWRWGGAAAAGDYLLLMPMAAADHRGGS